MTASRRRPESCQWCGRDCGDTGLGRRRLYCGRSCRQRAYEQRNRAKALGLPEGSVVLTADEVTSIADRIFTARCAAEDVATAVDEGAASTELAALCSTLVDALREAERLR
ncbi:hypothetical protein DW322_14250 [Rhodococcus rhodnii]|uniref:Uncharacterized protein n=2 Tax=Rhodococcus rhodnii TaxID=38312 RepID=R7WST8_9NOCA|nr:hypothetical protein [Rhodococcus rhodnii]EOM78327.1 hypothetical protein Rrhod_0155 [Rhodococcus rhodnii LMG 5362]TXG91168.1 hypothetical protein DW322_14250 [Rhodococcus rhodnii]